MLDLFLSQLTLEVRDKLSGDETERALGDIADAARAAWGDRFVSDEEFAVRLATLAQATDDPASAITAIRGADLYLAHCALAGKPWALAALEAGPLTQALRGVARRYSDPTVQADCRARVLELLLVGGPDGVPKLEQYGGRAAMSSWVRAIALRCAARLAQPHAKPQSVQVEELADKLVVGDSELLAALKEGYRKAFRGAFAKAVHDLSIHDRVLLKHNALDGLSIDEIAAANDVHRATAARWLARIRDKLSESTRRHLADEIGVESGEVEAILETIASRLDASISRLLGTSV